MSLKRTIALPNADTTAYWEYGSDRNRTIIMIHGFRGTHHGLKKIVEQLPEYRIIVPDMPGFGESSPLDQPHDIDGYVAFLKEFIAALKLKSPPVLLGHSFGSIITSHFAARYPHMITKLILVNPISAPALEGPRGVMTRLAIAYYWLGKKLPQSASTKWLSAKPIIKIMSVTMAKSKDRATRAFIHDQHLQHFSTFADRDVLSQAFRTSVSNDVSHVADALRVPTLLIAGELDDITTIKKQRELQAKIPSSQLHIIDGVGHLIHYEKPVEAATAIRTFLQQ